MEYFIDTLANLPNLLSAWQLVFLVVGVSCGIVIGALPGVGPLLGVVMAIPFTFYMDPVSSMALLMGIYQGGSYGGALSAVVIGIPGTPMSAATLLDARPMALKGKASYAVTLATVASSLGGIISAFVLIAAAPILADVALRFGPAETAAFAMLGLTTMGALSSGSAVKGWLMGFLGLLIAAVGLDPVSGVTRFTMGSVYLEGGIPLVPLLVGLFSISEILIQIEKQSRADDSSSAISASSVVFKTVFQRPFNYIRSSLIGVFVGILPGLGGTPAAFLSYRAAQSFKKAEDPDFRDGNTDGVIASEAANSAVTGGALIPMLALGIPGDAIVAVLMGGLVIQGIQPGAAMFTNHPEVVQGVFAVFLVGAVLLLPLGLTFLRAIVGILKMPQWAIMSGVLMISIVGTYAVARQIMDIWMLLIFGVIGYLLRKTNYPLAPIIIGFVLGPIFEKNFRRTGLISQGDFFGYIWDRPITMAVLGVILIMIVLPLFRRSTP